MLIGLIINLIVTLAIGGGLILIIILFPSSVKKTTLLRVHAILALVINILPFLPFYENSLNIFSYMFNNYGVIHMLFNYSLVAAMVLAIVGAVRILMNRSNSIVLTFSAAAYYFCFFAKFVLSPYYQATIVAYLIAASAIGIIVTALLYIIKYRGAKADNGRG